MLAVASYIAASLSLSLAHCRLREIRSFNIIGECHIFHLLFHCTEVIDGFFSVWVLACINATLIWRDFLVNDITILRCDISLLCFQKDHGISVLLVGIIVCICLIFSLYRAIYSWGKVNISNSDSMHYYKQISLYEYLFNCLNMFNFITSKFLQILSDLHDQYTFLFVIVITSWNICFPSFVYTPICSIFYLFILSLVIKYFIMTYLWRQKPHYLVKKCLRRVLTIGSHFHVKMMFIMTLTVRYCTQNMTSLWRTKP